MKTISLFSLIFWLGANLIFAQVQGVAINTDNSAADPTAILDVKSTNRGVLFPRMTQAQRLAIVLPAPGLFVFQTDGKVGLYVHDGTKWLLMAFQDTSAPAGTIMAFAGPLASVPTGWLPCNGAAVGRMTNPDLFAAIGTAWGNGDGATTFNVPNLQGRFLRGLSGGTGIDPDAGGRTASAAGGNTGDAVGTIQGDVFSNHSHGVNISGSTNTAGSHSHQYVKVSGASDLNDGGSDHHNPNTSSTNQQTDPAGDHTHPFTVSGNTGNPTGGGNETRPKNAYVLYIIKL